MRTSILLRRMAIPGLVLAAASTACNTNPTTGPLTQTDAASARGAMTRNMHATASTMSVSLTAVQAQKAEDFVNSIGVNTHLSYLSGTVYGNYAGIIKPRLTQLGVKHLRDGMIVESMNSWMDTVYKNRWNDLHSSLGITFNASTSPGSGQTYYSTPNVGRFLQFVNSTALESFEGLNEIDDQHTDTTWPAEDRAWQIALYTTVKANPAVSNLPVIGPSLVNRTNAAKLAALGDLTAFMDYGNMHPYPGDSIPSAFLSRDAGWYAPVNGTLKVIPTETGYPTVENPSYWVSEAAEGKYTPRLYLEYWNYGFPRTFDYQLADALNQGNGVNGWGLIHADGSVKPAFQSLAYLIWVLKDEGSQSFTPSKLSFSIGTVPSTIHHAVFQKSNGHYFLVLWNEVSSFSRATHTDINVPTVNTTLTLSAAPKSMVFWRTTPRSRTPTGLLAASVPIQIPDYPMIIEIGF